MNKQQDISDLAREGRLAEAVEQGKATATAIAPATEGQSAFDVQQIIAAIAESPRAPKFVFPSLAEFITQPLPEWLIPGMICTQSIVLLYGASEQGKTLCSADIALTLAERGKKAVYVAAEGGNFSLPKRVAAWLDYHGYKAEDFEGRFIPYPKPVNLFNREEVDELLYSLQVQNITPDFLIFDTVGMSMEGGKGNDNDDIHQVVRNVRHLITSLGKATAMLVHHTGKNEILGPLGAAAFKNDVDTMIAVSKEGEEQTKLVIEKQRDDLKNTLYRYLKPHTFNYYDSDKQQWVETTSAVAIPTGYSEPTIGPLPVGQQLTILAALALPTFEQGASMKELENATAVKEASLYRPLGTLLKAGWARQVGKKGTPYIVTEEGRAALASARQQVACSTTPAGNYESGASGYSDQPGDLAQGEHWPDVLLPKYHNGSEELHPSSSLHEAANAERQRLLQRLEPYIGSCKVRSMYNEPYMNHPNLT